MKNNVGIIGAPITIAQPNLGVDFGPNAIRYAGLAKRLDQLNITYNDYGNINIKNEGSDKQDPKTNLKNLDEVVKGNQQIAEEVKLVKKKGEFPLILGGDHSIAIGTLAGLYEFYDQLGVIWFDAHADLNTGETSPSGNIHGMSLAVNLGVGDEQLTSINGNQKKVKPENTIIIGARSIDDGERDFIKEQGIKVYTMYDIERKGMENVMKEAIQYLKGRVDGVHLSLDVDGIDPLHTPGTGTRVVGGPSYRETHMAMSMLHDAEVLTSVEVVEVNPLLDDQNKTAEVAADIIAATFGEKYL
ncbi:arginase [Alkalibacillus silvisoli]|uniref:Arginase n=1 Tax=Alkalibacillus silvisoli TaxID=392823 RepID=A0ABP3JUW8_9BACI